MPIETRDLSVSQFAELMGIDPARFHSVRVVWYKPVPVMPKWERKIVVYSEADESASGNRPADL